MVYMMPSPSSTSRLLDLEMESHDSGPQIHGGRRYLLFIVLLRDTNFETFEDNTIHFCTSNNDDGDKMYATI